MHRVNREYHCCLKEAIIATINSVNNTQKVTTYTSANTWTPDPRMVSADVYIWNGGGGGGSGRCGASGTSGGGAGGGAGNCFHCKLLKSNLQSPNYAVTIGSGGNGGISINAVTTNGNPGNGGGVSSLGVIVCPVQDTTITTTTRGAGAGGGTGASTGGLSWYISQFGNNATSGIATQAQSGSGGNGGSTVGSATNISINFGYATGGGGACGYTIATPRVGVAGGSILNGDFSTVLIAGGLAGANTGATAGDGNPATAFELFIGGTGGGGGGMDGNVTAGTGGNGGIPSGGGGGGAGNLSSNPSGAGGNGARGQIVIIEYF